MNQVIKTAMSYISIVLSFVFLLGLHLGAMAPPAGHTVDGTSHSAGTSIGCATICTSVNLQKQDDSHDEEDIQGRDPDEPYYAQFKTDALLALMKQHGREARSTVDREPLSGGPPAYIALSVSRT